MNEYQPRFGVSVAVDCIHNTLGKIPTPFGVLTSFLPPGDLYIKELQDDHTPPNVNITSTIDWSSPNRSIKFLDGFYHY